MSAEDESDDDESLAGDDTTFEPGKEVEQALRMLESGQQLPRQPVLSLPLTSSPMAEGRSEVIHPSMGELVTSYRR